MWNLAQEVKHSPASSPYADLNSRLLAVQGQASVGCQSGTRHSVARLLEVVSGEKGTADTLAGRGDGWQQDLIVSEKHCRKDFEKQLIVRSGEEWVC